ncbi:hypothetical protein HPB47_012080 [Ixodes persulcatus]|uniref:Uncharacterized protein n=1 Tax=Ixodes persulcatus TaxID=34615 RepID=A0AC60NUM0_IXOPE|nr:hypothetical protein HPB47_012080 [Ixodes persulcatus]
MNRLQAKIAQNKLLDKLKKAQQDSCCSSSHNHQQQQRVATASSSFVRDVGLCAVKQEASTVRVAAARERVPRPRVKGSSTSATVLAATPAVAAPPLALGPSAALRNLRQVWALEKAGLEAEDGAAAGGPHGALDLDSSDSEPSDDDENVWQRPPSFWNCDLDCSDASTVKSVRYLRIHRLRTELRKRYELLCKRQAAARPALERQEVLVHHLAQAARLSPRRAAQVLLEGPPSSSRQVQPRGGKAASLDKPTCCYQDEGGVCAQPALPYTRHCTKHGLNARPSTSRPVTGVEDMASTSTDCTVQAHLQPNFVLTEESRECAAAVRESLSSVSATERKMNLTGEGQKPVSAEPSDEYLVVQVAALNALLSETPCPKCLQPGVAVVQGTRLDLAVKMLLTCSTCGVVSNHWSSPRQEDSRAFEVNLKSMQAMKSVGKGATALTDFWSVMNVSYRGMHHKTFQGHLKSKFSPAADTAAAGVFTDAVNAVRKVYEEMNPTFTKNVAVIYDGTWMTRGHTSHIGVGTVIEYYIGLVLDSVVLSNLCHGCAVGPKPDAEGYSQWVQSHKCQRNTEVKSGRMEVEAALLLFGRSLAKNDLRYTNIVCNGDSRTFLAHSEDATYGFIPFEKEDCINHVQKRMGSALRALITKGKKGQPLGGRGGLTQELIKRLTSYYGNGSQPSMFRGTLVDRRR